MCRVRESDWIASRFWEVKAAQAVWGGAGFAGAAETDGGEVAV